MSTKLDKKKLQDDLKNIMDQIKQTYYQYLSSLKFQNITDKIQFKTLLINQPKRILQSSIKSSNNEIDLQQEYNSQLEYHKISDIQDKQFSFQEELAVENKGYLAFVRLINNIKQLQDYNQLLRSLIMAADTEEYLNNNQIQFVQDLKMLENQIMNSFLVKK